MTNGNCEGIPRPPLNSHTRVSKKKHIRNLFVKWDALSMHNKKGIDRWSHSSKRWNTNGNWAQQRNAMGDGACRNMRRHMNQSRLYNIKWEKIDQNQFAL
jgi:hypothetical protein